MNAYHDFLDFFSMHNKERLDGLSESYFSGMTEEEKSMAFNFLLQRVKAGGAEESVNGLFLANAEKAADVVKALLENEVLRGDAKISAAWNLYRMSHDSSLIAVFIEAMSSSDKRLRAKAAYYVPSDIVTPELICALKGMVRTETERLALINATNKVLECYGVTRDSVDKDEFSKYYRGLRSDDQDLKEQTFKLLEALCGSAG